MARAENFYLDTRGGAFVLQRMTQKVVHASAKRIAQQAMAMSGKSSGHVAKLKVVGSVTPLKGKSGSERYTASIISGDDETDAQMRHGNYVAKARDAGRI